MRPEVLAHSISPSIVPLDPVAHPAQYLSVRGISRSKGRLLGPHVLHTCHRHEPLLSPRNRDPAPRPPARQPPASAAPRTLAIRSSLQPGVSRTTTQCPAFCGPTGESGHSASQVTIQPGQEARNSRNKRPEEAAYPRPRGPRRVCSFHSRAGSASSPYASCQFHHSYGGVWG